MGSRGEWKSYPLIFLITLGLVAAMEAVVRVTGAAAPERYFPEMYSSENWGDFAANVQLEQRDRNGAPFRVTTNKWGLRSTGAEIDSPWGLLLALGDSFTLGVVDDTGTYPYQLQKILFPRRWQVLNAGSYGATLEDELGFLTDKLPLFQPDIVVLGYCRNDISDYAPFWRQSFRRHGRGSWREAQPVRSALKRNLHLMSLAKKFKLTLAGQRLKATGARNIAFDLTAEQRQAAAITPEERAKYQAQYADDFTMLLEICRRHGIALLPAIFPSLAMMMGLEENPDGDFLDSLFRSHDIPYLDLKPHFQGAPPESLFIAGDGHPTALGNTLAAQAIFRTLDSLKHFHIPAP